MGEGVVTPDGKAVAIDAAKVEKDFARFMSAPVEDIPTPPKRAVPTPTDAPKPKRGRPPKSEQPRTAKSAPAASKADSDADTRRAEGVAGLVQMGAGLCLVADMRTPEDNIAWRADAVTLANAAEPLSKACAEVARNSSSFAAVLDKVTQVGPYGALISVGLSVIGQLAYNHGVGLGAALGAQDPKSLIESVEGAANGGDSQ